MDCRGVGPGVGHVEPGALGATGQGRRGGAGTVAHPAHLRARQLQTDKNVSENVMISDRIHGHRRLAR